MATLLEKTPPVVGPRRERGRALLVVLFVVYLALLVWLVLWKLEPPYVDGTQRVIKLVPFVRSSGLGSSAPREVVANVLLFIPFGLYLGLLLPSRAWWKAAAVIAVASASLELAQYVLAVGSSDVTDVITNTAGGLIGIGLLALLRVGLRSRTTAVVAGICTIGTAIALLAVTIVVASPLRYAPPRDSAPASEELPPGVSREWTQTQRADAP